MWRGMFRLGIGICSWWGWIRWLLGWLRVSLAAQTAAIAAMATTIAMAAAIATAAAIVMGVAMASGVAMGWGGGPGVGAVWRRCVSGLRSRVRWCWRPGRLGTSGLAWAGGLAWRLGALGIPRCWSVRSERSARLARLMTR